jgi:hypothetical protein
MIVTAMKLIQKIAIITANKKINKKRRSHSEDKEKSYSLLTRMLSGLKSP